MILSSIISAILIAGFAFIIIALADKESGNMKLTGQIIAALVAIVAVVVLILGFSGRSHYGMMRPGMPGLWREKMTQNMPASMEAKGMKIKARMHKGLKK